MQEQNTTSLNHMDLVNIVNFIDIVATRGAIKGEELATVGQMRSRFMDILRPYLEQEAADKAAKEAEQVN